MNESVSEKSNNEEELKFILDLSVSANKLKSYLRVKVVDKDAVVKFEDVKNKIDELGITYGIREDDIKAYCEKKEYYKELIVAEGLMPVDEKNAYINYNFDIDENIQFKEKDDGTIDFKDINNIKSIKKGELLCTKVEIEPGKNGIDIYGNPIDYRRAKDINLPIGKNTVASKDNLKLYANVDGCIKRYASKIDVDDVYTVKSVDHSTGNIDFIGSVLVKEDVKAGFTVKAKNDIVIKGMVEGATLVSGGNITISNGMNGRDIGKIIAGGTVTSKYLENASVTAGKNVYSEAIINCDIDAGENIILKGSRASIIGGEIKAGDTISAKTIGTKNNIQTKIIIDLDKYFVQERKNQEELGAMGTLQKEIRERETLIKQLDEKIKYVTPYIKKSPDNEKLYKLLILKKVEVNKDINTLKTRLLEQKDEKKKIVDHKILCSGIIYANTRINIGWLKYYVREDLSYSKIYNDGNDIKITPLLPSDLNMEG